MTRFSKDFLWGGATAANQYEGGAHEGGAGLSTADVMTNGSHTVRRQVTWRKPDGTTGSTPLCFGSPERHLPEGAIPVELDDPKYYYPSHLGSDFYHFYKEDIRLCAEEGFNCLRFSLKWSRIFPNGDDETPNQAGIDFYRSVFEECKKYGIEPLVTLEHYENPLSLAQRFNGWDSRELVDMYVKYATTCFKEYQGLVKYYLTFNEINLVEAAPYVTAGLIHADPQNIANAAFHQFLASAKTVIAAHKDYPELRIGMMLAYGPTYGLTPDPEDQLLAQQWQNNTLVFSDVQMLGRYPNYKLKEYERNGIVIPAQEGDWEIIKEGTCDFLSFSTYGSHTMTTHLEEAEGGAGGNGGAGMAMVRNPYLKTNAWGWATDPQCLRITLNTFYDRYHCDLWCVENGIGWNDKFEDGTVHDDYRIDYMRANIKSMRDAVEFDGIPLMGYLYWGCVDMVSNGEGERAKRYGQIYVDLDDLGNGTGNRCVKDSYHWYKKCIESNGEDLD
ncbi:MAG: glycoside hydrolase family 1 protein [Firmicutes bacterium]|nr:glycoside hydrolase family 1 protein [Bacillota bacterium]